MNMTYGPVFNFKGQYLTNMISAYFAITDE